MKWNPDIEIEFTGWEYSAEYLGIPLSVKDIWIRPNGNVEFIYKNNPITIKCNSLQDGQAKIKEYFRNIN